MKKFLYGFLALIALSLSFVSCKDKGLDNYEDLGLAEYLAFGGNSTWKGVDSGNPYLFSFEKFDSPKILKTNSVSEFSAAGICRIIKLESFEKESSKGFFFKNSSKNHLDCYGVKRGKLKDRYRVSLTKISKDKCRLYFLQPNGDLKATIELIRTDINPKDLNYIDRLGV